MTLPHRQLVPLTTPEQFAALVAASSSGAVVIYKHSPTCGTSAQAYDEIEAWLDESPVDVHLVDVRASRALSQAIAEQLRVRHESPQLLVLRNGIVVWHASHWRVTAAALRSVFEGIAEAARVHC